MILAVTVGACGLLCVASVAAVLAAGRDRISLALGAGGALVACAGGATTSAIALALGTRSSIETPFNTALGPLRLGIDPLSAFFLLCVFALSGLAALYGVGYMHHYIGRRRISSAVANFNLLVASMALVVLARDAVLFLAAWEGMSVASYFLVTYENDREDVRRAGTTYLIASHTSVALLFVLFLLLSRSSGSFHFEAWTGAVESLPTGTSAAVGFGLALLGFGMKAGFWPVHVWLPVAHPAAPSHVSTVMSGVMIKMGIYGLLRILAFFGPPPIWWGALLLGLGAAAGLMGVLHALAQNDLKRLLAFSTVENVGIISLGIGLGLVGRSLDEPAVAFLGFAGALLHVLFHGIAKGLLFMGAGAVLHATGAREMDRLGGLQRRMPRTAIAWLVGAVTICGLPPMGGFVSEWLIYVGAFRGAAALPIVGRTASLVCMTSLALIGGLAAACFVKAFGVVFLGVPRSESAEKAHEPPASMTGAMLVGAALCAATGFAAVPAVKLIAPVAAELAGSSIDPLIAAGPLGTVVLVSGIVIVVLLGLALLRWALLRNREVKQAATWGCGYVEPTARMQYTGASFAEPVLAPFSAVFRRSAHIKSPDGFFPKDAHHEEQFEDRAEGVLVRVVSSFVAALARISFLQHGRVQRYLVYVLATLVALLVWQAVRGAP